tara:strand:- start:1371 stop:2381 length:1011 start_codon:yes stop_codon:yes gene_type:complete
MKELVLELNKYKRSFPIGLSNLPGIGYILTGGISPLSRNHGLAIDHIQSIKGYLGSGEEFKISRSSLNDDFSQRLWKSLRGAAPFIGIVTEVILNTITNNYISIITGTIDELNLEKLILLAEDFPKNISLHWFWDDKIKFLITSELVIGYDPLETLEMIKHIDKLSISRKTIESINNINQVSNLKQSLSLKNKNSEVISLLGPSLKKHSSQMIKCISKLIKNRPNKLCYIACQQLGGYTSLIPSNETLFIHRDSIWKPWINVSWDKHNEEERIECFNWLNNVWNNLNEFFPNIHLAQIHPHLSFHKKEIKLAFNNKLDLIKNMKEVCDPNGILVPL